MPTTVTAADGDSLCKFAVEAGFLNCDALRALPANQPFLNRPLRAGDLVTIPDPVPQELTKASDSTHEFVKLGGPPPQIRFVHGSPTTPYKDDATLDRLEISRYLTDKGGAADGAATLPDDTVCEFNAAGHEDADTFKVEVFDPANQGKEIDVIIEALRPVYGPDGKVKEHVFFPGSVDDGSSLRGQRSLKVKAKKVGKSTNTMRFRSPYLRLVTDEADKTGTVGALPAGTFPQKSANQPRPKQTVLVTDMVDEGDPQVEILDQLVEARFEFKNCAQSGDQKCACRARLPVGDDRQRLALHVHILRREVGKTPVVDPAHARRRVLRWMRRILAQASITPDLLGVTEVDPIENFLTISNPAQNAGPGAGGRLAAGDGDLGFTISAAGQPTIVVGPIKPAKGQSAKASADALASLVVAPYSATAFDVPVRSNDTRAAADLLIQGPPGAVVVLSAIVSTDSEQRLAPVRLNPLPTVILETTDTNTFTGTVHQRALCRNYDTGDDRVDLFVIDQMDQNSRGEAMLRGREFNPPARRGAPGVFLSVFMARRTMDGTDNDPVVLPHEIGHAVADVFHAAPPHQMMNAEVTGNMAIGGTKRIRNARTTYGGTTTKINLVERLRAEGSIVLRPW
jgi:hypothetical protein